MNILSPPFLIFALMAIVLVRLTERTAFRAWVLLALSLTFILSFTPDRPAQLLPLAGFLALSWGFVAAIARWRSNALLATAIVTVLVVFIWLKQYRFARFLPSIGFPYLEVGLSYILFRVIQVMVDSCGGLRERIGVVQFLNFTCFFPAFISGPVQRYQDFRDQMATVESEIEKEEILAVLRRILWGIVKVALLSAFLLEYLQDHSFANNSSKLTVKWWVGLRWYTYNCAVYTVYLYLNFSGYTDIVVGLGQLLGFRLPENFNRPYLAANYMDMWARWHMSVSNWFKIYVFNSITAALARRWSNPMLAPYFAVAGFFITFFLVGVWHVPTLHLGLTLALGVSANKLYQTILRKRLGAERYKFICGVPAYRHAARGLTLGYFAVSITAMWAAPADIRAVFGRSGQYLAMPVAILGLAMAATVLSVTGEAVVSKLSAWWARRPSLPLPVAVRALWLGAEAFVLVVLALATLRQAPDFVYMGF